MARSPVSGIFIPSNSSTSIFPPPATESNQTSGAPPPPSTSAPAPQSPPPPDVSTPPPSPPLPPPPTEALPPPVSPPPSPPLSPPASTPPSAPATPPPPPPASTSSPPQIISPPPPPEVSLSPPISSPPPPSEISSPPQPPPVAASPPPPAKTPSPPSPVDSPPPPLEESPTTPTITPPPPSVPVSPTASPPPPTAISSPPPPPSPTPVSPTPPISTEKPPAMQPKHSGGLSPGSVAVIGVVVGVLVLSLVMAACFAQRRKRRNGYGYGGGYVMPSPSASSQKSDSLFTRPQNSAHLGGSGSGSNFMYSPDPNSKSSFTYEELSDATQGFSAQKLLGEGGFGCVYKGLLVDGREVAVKQLKIGGGQGEREFRAEVEIISRVHHRHLVSLIGYCISDHQRLLVYEYVPNNTLHYHLHGEGRPVMEWPTRVKVAAGAARGIAYLHEDCHPRIIHRDIKSSNILLDNNFDARVADFGLAKLAADANTHVTTRVMGTFGYLAPEYASSGKLTEKSDVFSYGVVLLELITGRKPVDASQPLGDESLVEWARPLLNEALENERFDDLIDPRLDNNHVEIEMFRMIEAAAACIRHLSSKRPRMSQVVRAFNSMAEHSDLTNGMKLGQSQICDSREQSAQIRMLQRAAFGSLDYSSGYFDRSHSSWKS